MARVAPLSVTSLRGLTTFRQAFALALEMHPTTQQPVDVTYGRGGMWRAVNGQQPLRCDGNAALPNLDVVILWRDQPAFLGRHSRELLVADPIFVDDVGKDSAWRRYALRAEGPAADGTVDELLEELLAMAREVLCPRRGTLLLKLGDGNHGDRPQRNAYLVNQLVDRFGLYVCSQWTVPSRSMPDTKRQTVRHFPANVHLFAIHPYPRCRHRGLRLVGRTRCAWCSKGIVVQRVGTHNYCSAAHKQAAYRRRERVSSS